MRESRISSIALRVLAGSAVLLGACAHAPALLTPDALHTLRHGPLEIGVGGDASPDTLWQALARTDPFDGRLTAQTRFSVVQGDAAPVARHAALAPGVPSAPAWSGSLGAQRWTQSLGARLPTPFAGAPLELEWQAQHERAQHYRGTFASHRTRARARWSRGPLRLEIAPTGIAQHDRSCRFDAQLSGPDAGPGDARLSLRGQRCRRSIAGAIEDAQLWSTQAQWRLGGGSTSLGFTQFQYRDVSAGEDASAVEFTSRQDFSFGGWTFSGALGWRPADRADPSAWASRARLSRSLWGTPVSASWRRHDPAVWSVDSAAAAAHETALGVDLSPQLQQWLSPALGAKVSYHHLQPDSPRLRTDARVMMNLVLAW